MTDYKGIHAKLQKEDHDYRAGWREEREGRWLFVGMIFAVAIMLIGSAL